MHYRLEQVWTQGNKSGNLSLISELYEALRIEYFL